MSEQLQLRRGTASQIASFTGAQGEVVVDTSNNRIVLQDGSAAGGYPAAKLSEVVTNARTAISDASYAALPTDRTIGYVALTAARTIALPAASAYPTGTRLLVVDESGSCSATNTIVVACAGSDTINGQTSFIINSPYGFLGLESNGSNAWTVTDSLNTVATAPHGGTIQFAVIETLVSGLSGASVTAPIGLPANCIVFAVGAYVVTAITGATSYSISDAASSSYGSSLGVAAGSYNYGLIGPKGVYTGGLALTLTAAGGDFTGGAVRLSYHVAFTNPSTS
jgi:Major tropism determinant N-terminal domain